jgi:hypothetical protein
MTIHQIHLLERDMPEYGLRRFDQVVELEDGRHFVRRIEGEESVIRTLTGDPLSEADRHRLEMAVRQWMLGPDSQLGERVEIRFVGGPDHGMVAYANPERAPAEIADRGPRATMFNGAGRYRLRRVMETGAWRYEWAARDGREQLACGPARPGMLSVGSLPVSACRRPERNTSHPNWGHTTRQASMIDGSDPLYPALGGCPAAAHRGRELLARPGLRGSSLGREGPVD